MSGKKSSQYWRSKHHIRRKHSTISSTRKKCHCLRLQQQLKTSLVFPPIWKKLQENNQLCDGKVKCEDGVVFNIHRIILSAVSPYFRALFTNSINRGCPEIKDANLHISSGAFQVIIDYAYTGNCVINESNVFEVLKYADQYEILDVAEKCCAFLVEHLDSRNCLQVLKFSVEFGSKYLTQRVRIYLLQHFAEVLKDNEEFFNLPVDHLKQLLSDDCLNVKSEELVCEAIKTWLKYSLCNRKQHLAELMKCVRLGHLSQEKISSIAYWPAIQADSAAFSYITEILDRLNDYGDIDAKPLNSYLLRPRIPYDIIFAIGGWSAGSPTSFIETYDNRADKWLVSKYTDILARAYHGICSFNGKIYVIGGFDGMEYFNTVRCFNPVTHTWQECACMYHSRCYVSVVLCMNKIYAMGGYNGRSRMNSAERFDPVSNHWEVIPVMQKQRSDASAASLHDKVYIVGGFNGQEVMNSAEMFDPTTNQWSYIPKMISARSGVSLMAFHDALYAIGGFNGYTRLASTEQFIPDKTPTWTEVSGMMTPRSNFGCVILDDYIYVIGGFNGSTTINYMEYYDAEMDEWVDAASMNLNRSALCACVISGLPNSKDYSFLDRSQKQQNEDVKGNCEA